jgi:hypothetical protein
MADHTGQMTVLVSERSDAHVALFGAEAFHALNLGPDERYLRVDHAGPRGAVAASLCGRLRDDGTFVSGASAPFGGLDLADAGVDPAAALGDLLEQLRAHGATRVEVRARPAAHGPAAAAAEAALGHAGFTVTGTAVNQHLDLGAWPDPDAYLAALPKKRRWALRQDFAAGGVLQDADRADRWAQVHAVIDAARTVKGRPRWLAPDYLARLRGAFPGRVTGHLLTVDAVPVASAVVYRVADGVDLLAAWGDTGTLRRSPMNLLAFRLVEQSLATGARVLDLGISSEPDGTPNEGLIHFKRSVGARDGVRLTFAKDLT